MRITRGNVESVFRLFIQELGGKVADGYIDYGTYQLNYVGRYGGYQIERISDTSTGVSAPFGDTRHSTSEMYAILCFGLRTLEVIRLETNTQNKPGGK